MQNVVESLAPDILIKKKIKIASFDEQSEILVRSPSRALPKYIKTSVRTACFYLT